MSGKFLACIGVLAFAASIGNASAADLGRRQMPTKAPAYVAPYYNWTGFYVGINGGGGWGRADITSPLGSTGNFNASGGMVGGTLGYNMQTGPWVFGLEGDMDWADLSGTTSSLACPGCGAKNDWLATVRGRVGYAFDRVMPYITGGAAFGDVRTDSPGFGGHTSTQVGWTLGGGVEFAVVNNWTAKAEYLYTDLGSSSCSAADCGAPLSTKFTAHLFRAGINYRF